MEDATKRCPYCGETILATAIKCKYCGEWLAEKSSVTPTPPPPRPSPPPPPPPRLATPTDLPQAQPEAEKEADALAEDKKDSSIKSKSMRILLLVELIIAIAIIILIFHQDFRKARWRILFIMGTAVDTYMDVNPGYIVSSLCISIPWAVVGLGTDFDWVTAIVLFILSFFINSVIIKHYEYKHEMKSKRE